MRRSRSSGHVKTGNLMSPPVSIGYFVLWGLIATLAMTTILQGSQGLGLSRLSLPFLIGTFFTGDRRLAFVLGFIAYTIGGWLFAFIYYFTFASVGIYTWWFGALAGFVHGIFLLVCALPLLPFAHPRDGVRVSRRDFHTPIRTSGISRNELLSNAASHSAWSDRLRDDT